MNLLAMVVGLLVVAFGMVGITAPDDRSRAVIDWWASQGPLFLRLAAVLTAAFGGFLIYATGSLRRAA